jgi:hypothetical protein
VCRKIFLGWVELILFVFHGLFSILYGVSSSVCGGFSALSMLPNVTFNVAKSTVLG